MVAKRTSLPLIITALLLPLICPPGCGGGEETGFGIFLVDDGELVLSEEHIKAYHKDTHTIELNEEGIQKWNSYMTWEALPKLADSLFSRDFALRIEGEEIYRGKFYSMVSSMSYPGVVILDALVELDGSNNTIRIDFGYPWPPSEPEDDPRNSPRVLDFLDRKGLLE